MQPSLKQIQPYILGVVIKEEKMRLIYYYTFSLFFFSRFCGAPYSVGLQEKVTLIL